MRYFRNPVCYFNFCISGIYFWYPYNILMILWFYKQSTFCSLVRKITISLFNLYFPSHFSLFFNNKNAVTYLSLSILLNNCKLPILSIYPCFSFVEVLKSCGTFLRENRTLFVNYNYPDPYDGIGTCQITLQKISPDICQYRWVDSMLSFWRNRILLIFRMDFDEFRLMGPETENNICENDQFIIAGAPNSVPIICGINTGNHSEFWSIFENCFGSRVGKNCTYSIWVTEYENGKEKSTILIVFPKKIPKFQLVRWGHMYFKTVFF